MYNPKSLYFHNLMSFQSGRIDFTEDATIVHGENNFDEGQSNNGSGKSATLEAFAIAVIGAPLRKDIVVTDLIKDGKDYLEVGLVLDNPMLNTKLEIRRTFHRSNSKKQEIVLNENLNPVEFVDSNHANALILEYLCISKEDLLNYYLLSKEKYKSFFRSTDGEKKNIIGRFSKIEMMDPVFVKLDTEIKSKEAEIQGQKDLLNIELGKLEVYNENLEKEKSRDMKDELETLNLTCDSNIHQAEHNLIQNQKNHEASKKSYDEAVAAIDKISSRISGGEILIGQLDEVLAAASIELNAIQADKNIIDVKLAEADRLLLNKIECPSCNFEFSITDKSKDLSKVKAAVPVLANMSKEKQIEYTNRAQLSEDSVAKRKSAIALKNEISIKKRDLEVMRDNLKIRVDAFSNNIQKGKDYIQGQKDLKEQAKENMKTSAKEAREKEISTLIDACIENRKSYEERIVELEQEVSKSNDLKNQFIKFRTSLVNKTVKVIEFYCNKFLEEMGSSLSVNIQGFRESPRTKKLIEKITTTVYRNGVPSGPFGRYSEGERSRIEIAGILALQSLINSAAPSGGLNFLFLDEIIGSLDSIGITGIVEELDLAFDKCIFVVTHASYDGNYDKVMKVTKGMDGNSTIEFVNVRR